MQCSECGRDNMDGLDWCDYCGSALPKPTPRSAMDFLPDPSDVVPCRRCGVMSDPGGVFCRACGNALRGPLADREFALAGKPAPNPPPPELRVPGRQQRPTLQFIECSIANPCDESWDGMASTGDTRVRHCARCDLDVHAVRTQEEIDEHREAGHCIAVFRRR